MKSEKRVFIKNLPETASQDEIEKVFSDYGNVKSVEIKERKTALPNQSLFFAYVNLETDDQSLQKCFQDFTSELWHGEYVELQLAKESFLERLRRERENSDLPKEIKEKPAPALSVNGVDSKKCINKQVSAESGTDSESENEQKDITIKPQIDKFSRKVADVPENDETTTEITDMIIKNNKHKILGNSGVGLKIESLGHSPDAKIERQKRKKTELSTSEAKRLKSMKNLIDGYKQQKSIIKAALSSVDFKPNKIVFDEDSNNEETSNTISITKEKSVLFGSDGESDNENFNFEVKSQFEGKKGQQLLELQSKYKNDKRFLLDERFAEEDLEERIEADDIEDEKKKEYQILEQVLGSKIKPKLTNEDNTKVSKGMLRFDPSLPDHLQYEIKDSSREKTTKKQKKKDREMRKEEFEVDQPNVSKDVFYKVSEDLKQTFEEKQEFSLLNMFGKVVEPDANAEQIEKDSSIKVLKKNIISGNNPFKYDSSDGEDEEVAEPNSKECKKVDSQAPKNTSNFWSEPFFFKDDDYRLQEGFDFMKRIASEEKSEFKQVRRNLKEIVKAKVKNNQRKNRPFKKKLGGSKRKKILRMKKAMKR